MPLWWTTTGAAVARGSQPGASAALGISSRASYMPVRATSAEKTAQPEPFSLLPSSLRNAAPSPIPTASASAAVTVIGAVGVSRHAPPDSSAPALHVAHSPSAVRGEAQLAQSERPAPVVLEQQARPCEQHSPARTALLEAILTR